MGKVSNILAAKGTMIYSVPSDTIVYDAIELMCAKNVGCLLVTEGNNLAGIFTERDYARKLILQGRASKETLLSEVMTDDLVTVTPETTIEECMNIMTSKFIRHLPVLDGDKLVGLISIGDVVKFTIDEQKYIIQNMEQYISGG